MPPPRRRRPNRGPSTPPKPARGFGLRTLAPGRFEITHPPCVAEREDDYADAIEAWRAGEPEEAREILRFALQDCGDNLWIHVALGQIAQEMGDTTLARGHFGYAFELVHALVRTLDRGALDPHLPGNRPFFEAAQGLIASLTHLNDHPAAQEIRRLVERLAPPDTRSS